MGEQILQPRSMKAFEEDSKWFYENIDSLRKKNLTGKFVVIKDKEIIASDNNLEIVIKFVEQRGEDTSYLLIEFVYPEETVVLLSKTRCATTH